MGNCCLERPRRRRGGVGAVHYARTNPVWWAEEDDLRDTKEEARKGEGEGPAGHAPPPATTSTEVKIRITRKQLEDLLRRVEDGKHGGGGGGAPVQEIISELLCVANSNNSSVFRHREEGQWRPSLQTIPE